MGSLGATRQQVMVRSKVLTLLMWWQWYGKNVSEGRSTRTAK